MVPSRLTSISNNKDIFHDSNLEYETAKTKNCFKMKLLFNENIKAKKKKGKKKKDRTQRKHKRKEFVINKTEKDNNKNTNKRM